MEGMEERQLDKHVNKMSGTLWCIVTEEDGIR